MIGKMRIYLLMHSISDKNRQENQPMQVEKIILKKKKIRVSIIKGCFFHLLLTKSIHLNLYGVMQTSLYGSVYLN